MPAIPRSLGMTTRSERSHSRRQRRHQLSRPSTPPANTRRTANPRDVRPNVVRHLEILEPRAFPRPRPSARARALPRPTTRAWPRSTAPAAPARPCPPCRPAPLARRAAPRSRAARCASMLRARRIGIGDRNHTARLIGLSAHAQPARATISSTRRASAIPANPTFTRAAHRARRAPAPASSTLASAQRRRARPSRGDSALTAREFPTSTSRRHRSQGRPRSGPSRR